MRQKKKFILFISSVLILGLLLYIISEVNYNNLIKKDIKDDFRSIIIDIYNPREWIKEPNYMKVRKNNGDLQEIYLTEDLLNYIHVGDSLIKVKDKNVCYVKKPNGEKREFYYTKIPMENRNHWTFPKEWRNKWMESSKWDTLR